MRLIRITRWHETFENADTRKRQRLKSFHCPSGIESRGLLNLLCHFDNKDALAAFGVFQLICQWSATLPADARGTLVHSDFSPMSEEFIARLLRIEICHLSAAIKILSDQRVGWIQVSDVADNLPEICHLHPDFVQGEGEGEGEEKNVVDAARTRGAPPPPIHDEWTDGLSPIPKPSQLEAIQKRINSLHPSWEKRPHFTRKDLEALHANSKPWLSVDDEDWALLKAYMAASIPAEWKADPRDFLQPDNRLGLIGVGPTTLLGLADRWKRKAEKAGIILAAKPEQKTA